MKRISLALALLSAAFGQATIRLSSSSPNFQAGSNVTITKRLGAGRRVAASHQVRLAGNRTLISGHALAVRKSTLCNPANNVCAVIRFDGAGVFNPDDFTRIRIAFESEFHKFLPISADGETTSTPSDGFRSSKPRRRRASA